jgi:Protein of unknown function DUF47
MKLRLLPRQEDAYFGLFEAAADTIVAAANTLLRMLGDLAEAEALAKQLADLEHEGDRITRDLLTRLATTFIAPLDRDEIFDLANGLDDVNDAIEEVGDLAVLHRISESPRRRAGAGSGSGPGGRAHRRGDSLAATAKLRIHGRLLDGHRDAGTGRGSPLSPGGR